MRVCFTSDLHGAELLYRQLDALLLRERPDLVILGGDLCVDADPADPLGTQVRYVHDSLVPRLRQWRDEQPDLAVGAIVGNHEWRCTLDELQSLEALGLLRVLDLHRVFDLDGVALLGYGCTPPTPFYAKDFERRDMPDEPAPLHGGYYWSDEAQGARRCEAAEWFLARPTIADDLADVKAPSAGWIFVCHAPPFQTRLDHLKGLRDPVGSRAVREFIERTQPKLTLHGHIHESPGLSGAFQDRIAGSLCVNPGQTPERLHAVVFDAHEPQIALRHTVYG